jgi:hypothetical protein
VRVQPNGQLSVVLHASRARTTAQHLGRLNVDGSLDPGFDPCKFQL